MKEGINAVWVWGYKFIHITVIEIAAPKVFSLMVLKGTITAIKSM
jgi:hypothetical protein